MPVFLSESAFPPCAVKKAASFYGDGPFVLFTVSTTSYLSWWQLELFVELEAFDAFDAFDELDAFDEFLELFLEEFCARFFALFFELFELFVLFVLFWFES